MKIFFHYQRQYPILILRPLLQMNRQTIKKWVLFFNLPISIDITNRFIFYRRNRIRFFLFPFLHYFFQIQIDSKIFRLLKLTTAQSDYFQKLDQKLFILSHLKKNFYFLMPTILQKIFIKKILKYSKKSFKYKEIIFINFNLFKNSNIKSNYKNL